MECGTAEVMRDEESVVKQREEKTSGDSGGFGGDGTCEEES